MGTKQIQASDQPRGIPCASLVGQMVGPLLLVCVVSACLIYVAHLGAIRASSRRSLERHLQTLARMGAVTLEQADTEDSQESVRAAFGQWVWAVATDPSVMGAALVDREGQVLELVPPDLCDPDGLGSALAGQTGTMELGSPIGWCSLVRAETIGGLGIVLITRPDVSAPLFDRSTFPFGISVLALLVLPVWWIGVSLRRAMAQPVDELIAVTNRWWEADTADLPTERRDRLGLLARNVSRLLKEHHQSRSRLRLFERTMDVRVAAQTKQIQAMLTRAERRAWKDSLTGLGNRSLLDDKLEELFANQKEADEDMSIVLFDLDHFKQLNDTLGHGAGDEILRFVGELLRSTLRPTDIGIRYGGDEFALILLDTGSQAAAEMAERLTKMFAQRTSLYEMKPPVTMSAGIASIKTNRPQSGQQLLELADAAMYQAKHAGKNAVRIYSLRNRPNVETSKRLKTR